MIVNGSSDFYWTTDALNVYWNDLPGNKWVLYLPNTGHDLKRRDRADSDQLTDFINGLAAFTVHQISGRSMPNLTWKHENANGKARLTIDATPAPAAARFWVAQKPTRDFRAAKWKDEPVTFLNGAVTGEVTPPEKGQLAFYGELDYEIDGLKYHLSTQIQTTE